MKAQLQRAPADILALEINRQYQEQKKAGSRKSFNYRFNHTSPACSRFISSLPKEHQLSGYKLLLALKHNPSLMQPPSPITAESIYYYLQTDAAINNPLFDSYIAQLDSILEQFEINDALAIAQITERTNALRQRTPKLQPKSVTQEEDDDTEKDDVKDSKNNVNENEQQQLEKEHHHYLDNFKTLEKIIEHGSKNIKTAFHSIEDFIRKIFGFAKRDKDKLEEEIADNISNSFNG